MLRWLALFSLVALLSSCSSAPGELGHDALDAEIEAIRKLESDNVAAWIAKDTAKIGTYYATDAFLQLANRPPVEQIDAIKRDIESMVKDPNIAIVRAVDNVEIAKSGEIAWSRGSYTATYTDPQSQQIMIETGRFVNTYRKVNDGTWKVVADIATPTGPAVPKPQNPQP